MSNKTKGIIHYMRNMEVEDTNNENKLGKSLMESIEDLFSMTDNTPEYYQTVGMLPKANLKPSILKLPYPEWKEYRNNHLFIGADKVWLREWRNADLARSPWVDEERRIARYWHHRGFVSGLPVENDWPDSQGLLGTTP